MSEDEKKVEDQEWYHGYRPRKDARNLLKTPGEFLVRATETGPSTDIVISVLDENCRFVNLTLKLEDGQWYIGAKKEGRPKRFKSITDLVNHYRAHAPSKKLKLSKVVSRPVWMIKHDQIEYNKDKDFLGKGNFCTVYKGTFSKTKEEEKAIVAIKIAHSSADEGGSEEAKEARKAMMHEAQIMSYYTHENVIRFHGVACDNKPILVVMEFCPGGDLQTHLQKRGKDIGVQEKVLYCYEASMGMAYLHNKKCVHRDLAARNCLIAATGLIKIADFGLSKMRDEQADKSERENESNAQIPLRWMAPESIKKPHPSSSRSDVWSFGVMIYEIFNNGGKPWPDDENKLIAHNIRRARMPKLPEKTPSSVAELTQRIWVLEPEKRPTMKDLFIKLLDIYKKDPIDSPEALVVNQIAGVHRTVLLTLDETESGEESGFSNHKNVSPLVRQRASRSRGKSVHIDKRRPHNGDDKADDKKDID